MASNGVVLEEIMRLKEVLKRTLDMAPAARVTFLRSLSLFHQNSEFFFRPCGYTPNCTVALAG